MKTKLTLIAIAAFAMVATTNAQYYGSEFGNVLRQAYGPNWQQVLLAAQVATAPNTGQGQVVVVNQNNGWNNGWNNNCYPLQRPVSWNNNCYNGFRPRVLPRPRIRCGW